MILGEMSWPEIEKGLKKTRTVILPVGAVEEHGPHLPVTTDTHQALEVAYEVARRREVFVAPPVHYGICRSTRGFPGTVSVGFNALRDYVYDILLGFHESNFRYVMVLSGHAGGQHMSSLKEACQSAVNNTDLRISLLTDFDLIRCDTPGDGHAGDIETSRMLLHRPDLVRGLPPANHPKRPRYLILRSVREFMGNGIMGDPSSASAEKGVRYFEMAVRGVLEALDELEGFSV